MTESFGVTGAGLNVINVPDLRMDNCRIFSNRVGQVIDAAVHLGTLGAVVLYFREDVALAARGLPNVLRGKIQGAGAGLAFCLILATIPVIIFGVFLALTGLDDAMRSIEVIGWAMLIFGIVLYLTDTRSKGEMPAEFWTIKNALLMGLWQALALIPGTSRSGITISAGRYLGYSRHGSAKLAMLMSIPAIIASGTYVGIDAAAEANFAALKDGAIAAVFAFISALMALAIMMRLLRSVSFTPYVIYRVILGLVLLAIAYT